MSKRGESLGQRARKATYFFLALALCGLPIVIATQAAELDYFGPPPDNDVSRQTGPHIGMTYADNALVACIDNTGTSPPGCTVGLLPANEGSFTLEGGIPGSLDNVGVNNIVQLPLQSNGVNIPTNSTPSPLFGAQPFTQQMVLFEEFGPEALNDSTPVAPDPFPQPTDYQHGPNPVALDNFLKQDGIGPLPTRVSNIVDLNPWRGSYDALTGTGTGISGFLQRTLAAPPAEGRPPGEGWAHQRWNEFKPQSFFKTAQAAARTNLGFRDGKQMHKYGANGKPSEFSPTLTDNTGLYYKVYGTDDTPDLIHGTTAGIPIRFHPLMPLQENNSLWTFDGTLPPKLLMARYGQPIMMRHYNALPIDPTANRGFGLHTITTHEHNGHSPAESDGYTNAFFFPGQFYDYRWPLQLAGYDTINTDATDPRAAFPCSPGETLFVNDSTDNTVTPKTCPPSGSIRIRGDWHETMSTHWFHDHMLDFTAQNVYKGNAVMMNYYSALDRGYEGYNPLDNVNLRFPSGTALDWGNRDYDVNLVIGDKAWDNTGQLWFNIFNTDGFLGDQLFTNWLYKPYMEVRARRYRFRILNGSVSRYISIALVRLRNDTNGELSGPGGSGISYDRIPLHMIANDGNIMEHAVPFDGTMDLDGDGPRIADDFKGILPTQSIAERDDIIVDFSKYGIQTNDKLYFVNLLEHATGRGVKQARTLAEVLSESYKAVLDTTSGGVPFWKNGDPGVGKFLEFRVRAYSGTDNSMNPDDYIPGRQTMIPLLIHHDNCTDLASLENMRHRTFSFGRDGTDASPWTIKTDDGLLGVLQPGFNMDPRRVSATPQLTTGPTQAGHSEEVDREVWTIEGGKGWDHPVHVHFEEGIFLSRGGPPEDPATCLRNRQDNRLPPHAPPEWEKWARKDMYRIGDSADSASPIVMAIRFREFAGTYVEHCHNTQHEDHAMLLRWDIEHPGQFTMMPTPMPTWDGVEYVDSAALPTVRTVQMYGSPVDNVTPGTSIACQATIIGVPGPGPFEYMFQERPKGGSWSLAQNWSANDNLAWSTSGYSEGAYEMKVTVREVGHTTQILGLATMPFTVKYSMSVSLVSDLPSPRPAGGAVTLTASTSGGSGSYEYQYLANVDGGPFFIAHHYSTDPVFNWTNTGPAGHTYVFQVNTRNVGSSAAAEATTTMTFDITAPPSALDNVTLVGPPSPQPAGGSVTLTASASGGSGSYEYQYLANVDGGEFFIAHHYSTDPVFNWTNTGPAGHTYVFRVNARNVGSSSAAEATTTLTYAITAPPSVLDNVTLAGPPSPQPAGGSVTLTASASGGSGSYEYEYLANVDGGPFFVAHHYSTDPVFNWTNTGPAGHTYVFRVNARNVGSTSPAEATQTITYTIN